MLPFTTVDTPWFREMTRALNAKYTPPNRDNLCNTLIPAWYNVEKIKVKEELKAVSHVAVTADMWSSVAQDHYITVTVHYVVEAELREKVLHTRGVYVSQTGPAVAEEIDGILDDFGVRSKVVAVTVDNAANMDVAVRKMGVLKMGCFAHTLNIAAQKLYSVKNIANWSGRIRSVVLWLRRNSLAKPVLKEKQKLLGLGDHSLILDVRTRWNSLFLMVERFIEQYPAIQAASRDPRIKKAMDRDRLERVSDDDISKCEDFVDTMRVLYTSTIAVSSDKSATAGQILPILDKLKAKFEVKDDDSPFKRAIKEKVWADLSHRYTEETNKELRQFLEEASALDPRFKVKVHDDEAVWTRVENAAVALISGNKGGEVTQEEEEGRNKQQEEEEDGSEGEEMVAAPVRSKKKLSALGELFEDEDQALLLQTEADISAPSVTEKAKKELQVYRSFPAVLSSVDPLLWWRQKRDQMPMLASLAKKYLCVQASSTPSERVFSTAGDTVSVERARLLPEKIDMLVFLKKNCTRK
ncbi:E3 SUMO-protein ligase ZBED1-like [Epinephelus fuscoguttatus]|uniref:E3 SUMO-protein ligase ZBED1-like n=1 Tax=Epinephelus fuscoguttatus TaxID=293821 RepID=UPI0020D0F327|nr:E3 SUMO-protein ligase ZBED1-like [Epinephelus fuscoguttatus]